MHDSQPGLTIMLQPLAPEGLHSVPTSIRPGLGFELPLRCTVVSLSTGGVALVSPVAFDDETAAAIDALGPVEHIVAPNLLHHLHLPAAIARWPRARVHGAPGLADKRRDVRFDEVLGAAAIDRELETIPIAGAPSISEVALHHRPSRALIVTDLMFHVHAPRGLLTPWILRMVGAPAGTLGQSRLWRFATKQRAAAAASARALVSLQPERLVLAHGEPIEHGATERIERALGWMLSGAPAALPSPTRA